MAEHRPGQGRAHGHRPARALGHDRLRRERRQRGPDRPRLAQERDDCGDRGDPAGRGQRRRAGGRPQRRHQLRRRRAEVDQGRPELHSLCSIPRSPGSGWGTEARWSILAAHTYTEPGIYYGAYTASDWGGGTDSDDFVVRVTGQQKITFPTVADHTYGDVVEMPATDTASSTPVTYTAGPADVCTPTGLTGEGGPAGRDRRVHGHGPPRGRSATLPGRRSPTAELRRHPRRT